MSTARPPANSALVELQGVSVVFGGKVRALDDVTLTITQGDIVGLVGESGSGKTTLCRAIVGLTPASSSSIGTSWPALLPPVVDTGAAVQFDPSSPVSLALQSLNVDDAEKQLIARALEAAEGNRTKAAELLGISVRTLRNKLNTPGKDD